MACLPLLSTSPGAINHLKTALGNMVSPGNNTIPHKFWFFYSQTGLATKRDKRNTTHLQRAQMATPPHWHPDISSITLWTSVFWFFFSFSTGLATGCDKPTTRHICHGCNWPHQLPCRLTNTLNYLLMSCELRFAGFFHSGDRMQQTSTRHICDGHNSQIDCHSLSLTPQRIP